MAAPDPNRGYYVTTGDDIEFADGMANPSMTETARHAAWVARGRLGTVMEELPFTEDRAAIIAALSEGIADVQGAIARLEEGEVSRERMREQYVRDDELQMATPPFMPGHTAKG